VQCVQGFTGIIYPNDPIPFKFPGIDAAGTPINLDQKRIEMLTSGKSYVFGIRERDEVAAPLASFSLTLTASAP
jgi:hypothetical protein